MREYYERATKAYEERTRNERLLLLLLLLALIFFLWLVMVYDALAGRRASLEQQLGMVQTQVAGQQQQLQELLIAYDSDPDSVARMRQAELERESAAIDRQLDQLYGQLMTPREMSEVLVSILQRETSLRLVSLENSAPQVVFQAQAGNDSDELPLQVYRHALTMELRGTYMETLRYLRSLEDLGLGAILDISGAADEDYSIRLVNSSIPADFSSLWTAGIADIEGNVIFNRASDDVPDGPFEGMQIVFVPVDSDGVTLDSVDVDLDDGITEPGTDQYRLIASHDFRYGRLLLRNAYGSELELVEGGSTLDIRLDVEYFDGSDFVINSLDDCSPYNSSELSFVSGSFTDNLSPGDPGIVPVSGAVFGGLNFENPANPDADDVPMLITPPGEGNEGSALVELDLEALNLEFLRYEWRGADELLDQNGDDSYDDNPRALIEFGTFRGHDRIINWQEVIQ